MKTVVDSVPSTLNTWRSSARACLERNLTPDSISWEPSGEASLLFGGSVEVSKVASDQLRVPRSFVSLASSVACHRDEGRWSLLYNLLWRLSHEEPHLMQIASDPLISRLVMMHRAVRRAAHKMKAFVRFKSIVRDNGEEEFVAWFEPAHRVVERTAPFFVDRFRSMRWSILTPDGCARWDGELLSLTPGLERHEVPTVEDDLEKVWRTYYAGIFNPSRLNRAAMRAEMPKQYWKNLPEASLIEELSRNAPMRMTGMIAQTLRDPIPLPADLDAIEAVAAEPATRNDTPWHPIYDPGWREARRRADSVKMRAPEGIHVEGTRVLGGVAGWTDPTLLARGVFYPDEATSAEDRLRFYASHLPMVEVDATYYALPSRETSVRWVERTPRDFVFNIKAHSLMTGHPTNPSRLPQWLLDELPLRLRVAANVYSHHFTRDALDEVWRRFLIALAPLREAGKLGAIMLQYPKWFTPTRESARELELARDRLDDCPATVELRHRDWYTDRLLPRMFNLLRSLKFSYVAVDAPPGMESSVPSVMEVTNPALAMFRFHGRRESTWEAKNDEVAERYRYLYSPEQLSLWVPAIHRAMDKAMRVHLTFNNNKWNYAMANALEMNELLLS
ncbi:MAG TPA: TIGR03915 family putative DNA repair protein [Gemmatimonadaceae bacterium]|nr:TIGR03915 family putative DNA repair protein [Gemmatimonadaceae bacterium]